MPSFHNVLDDAWLGSSVIATSNDSLVVRKQRRIQTKINYYCFSLLQACGYRLMRNISIDRYDSRGGCFKIAADRVSDFDESVPLGLIFFSLF